MGTAREARTNSQVTFSYELLHMNVPWLPDQQRLTYICVDTRHSLEDLTSTMDDRNRWQEKVRELHAANVT